MPNNKSNVFDYLDWRGDLTFLQSGFNEVDALVLSILAYLDFSCVKKDSIVRFKEAVEYINGLPAEQRFNGPGIIMRSVVNLANQTAKAARFQGMSIAHFVNETDEEREIQFAAITFLLPDGTAFLSFRGTDNTLVGWKEDLNMCFINGIPSQLEAANYLVKTLQMMNQIPVRMGGHSKGGNLAIWAGAHMPKEYEGQLLGIYSNDGPGFSEEFLQSNNYIGIRDKISSFVPESSIVGVLMEHDEYKTIQSSNPSVLQHDPFSWLVLGNHFVYDDTRSLSGRQFERVINSWIRAMSPKEREELVENVYDIISSSNAKTLEDLDKTKIRSLLSMQKTFREMGLKKQTQLLISLSKVIFNSDMFVNNNLLSLFWNNEDDERQS